jgi:hypothetical protein
VPLVHMADHAVFDQTDDAGIILDTRRNEYLGLNAIATLMLEAALRFGSVDEVVSHLLDRIDASTETVRAGLTSLIDQLEQRALLASTSSSGR